MGRSKLRRNFAILKTEPRTIADAFAGARILFADVVDFTPLSARMSPMETVELLNEVFSHFDTIVEKHGLEKIKTIGDCRGRGAAPAPGPRPGHCPGSRPDAGPTSPKTNSMVNRSSSGSGSTPARSSPG